MPLVNSATATTRRRSTSNAPATAKTLQEIINYLDAGTSRRESGAAAGGEVAGFEPQPSLPGPRADSAAAASSAPHSSLPFVGAISSLVPGRELVVTREVRLDEDLSAFYAIVREDPELEWSALGAGRMLRGPTVFEDVVKTICTTNTAWSGTRKMTKALVDNLGVEAPGGRRTFPSADAMAGADEPLYRDVIRAGYRGPYLKQLATDVAEGAIDLEELNDPDLPDDEAAARLLALPGVGPYAAAHIMLTSLGRYSRLVLDSWTRPTYTKLSGARRALKDATIERRFKRYGEWAGLAFWLYLTRTWVDEGLPV